MAAPDCETAILLELSGFFLRNLCPAAACFRKPDGNGLLAAFYLASAARLQLASLQFMHLFFYVALSLGTIFASLGT